MSAEVVAEVPQETKKEVKKELIPAPAPVTSPWKSTATAESMPELKVAELLEETRKRKNKSPQPAIKSSANTKWVPIQVSITVSNNVNSNNKRKNNNRKTRQTPKRAPSGPSNSNQQAKQSTPNSESKQNQQQQEAPQQTQNEKPVAPSMAEAKKTEEIASEQPQSQQSQTTQKPYTNQRRRYNNSPNTHTTKQFRPSSNNSNSTFNNGEAPRHSQHNNRYNKHSNRAQYSGYRSHNHHYNNRYQNRQMVKIDQSFYPLQPAMMAINNVARQIEYYFSADNMNKDEFLKTKLSKDGYAPLELISKFYRLVNMSFGGDQNIILAALREIVNNAEATVEVAIAGEQSSETEQAESLLTKYYIRSKEFSQWVPDTITNEFVAETILTEGSLERFMAQVITPPPRSYNHHKTTPENQTEDESSKESNEGESEKSDESVEQQPESSSTEEQ